MGHWVQQLFIFKESSVDKVYQPGTEIDSKDFVFGLDLREWNGFFSKGKQLYFSPRRAKIPKLKSSRSDTVFGGTVFGKVITYPGIQYRQ